MTINTDIFTTEDKQIPVEKLGFSNATVNALRGNNINTLGDLLDIVLHDNLMQFRNIGKVKYNEIMLKIHRLESKNFRDEIQLKEALIQKYKDLNKQINEYHKAIRKLTHEKDLYEERIYQLTKNISQSKEIKR